MFVLSLSVLHKLRMIHKIRWIKVYAAFLIPLWLNARTIQTQEQSCGRVVGKTRRDAFVCVLEKSVDLLAYPDIVIRWFKTGTSSSTEYQRNVANISFVAEETGKFGIYIVDCYRPNTKPIVRGQGMCYVNATVFRSASTPTDRPTSVTTGSPVTDAGNLGVSTGAETAGFRWDGTTISIASVSLVIITVVVACTLIYLRRSKTETDQIERPDDQEGLAGQRQCDDNSSIYNEIDADAIDYATIDLNADTGHFQPATSLVEQSPSLPKRPGTSGQAVQGVVYSDIRTQTSCPAEKIGVVYSTVNKSKIDATRLNAEPTGERSGSCSVHIRKHDTDRKRKEATSSGCSVLLPHHDDLTSHRAPSPRSSRPCSKISTQKGPEMQYVIIAHVEDGTDRPIRESPDAARRELPVDLDKVQYACIDFEKKAFVAPPRKAPSSWYKKKNKTKHKQ